MKKYLLQLVSLIAILVLVSCGGNGESRRGPRNVRELMESSGWEYCQLVSVDVYYHDKRYSDGSFVEGWIYEDCATYDLFRKGSDYALTRPHTDAISLDGYPSHDEHMKATYWINQYAIEGDYIVTADHARSGSGRLGVVTYRYNARCPGQDSDILFIK